MYLLDIYCIYGILVLFWYRFYYYFFKIENGYFFDFMMVWLNLNMGENFNYENFIFM